MVIRLVYDRLIKEIKMGDDYNDSSFKLLFDEQELEKEQLHSAGSRSIFGTRVPPRETKTFINILKVVSNNFEIPNSLYQKYNLRQIYQALCLSFYIKEYQMVENIIANDDNKVVKSSSSNNNNNNNNNSIDDEKFKVLLDIIKEMEECNKYDIDINQQRQPPLNPEQLQTLIELVFKDIDDNDDLQNVWFYDLQNRKQPVITDDDLKYLSHVSLRSNNDPQLILNDYLKKYPSEPRCAAVVIYLTRFCYDLLVQYFALKKTMADTREMTN